MFFQEPNFLQLVLNFVIVNLAKIFTNFKLSATISSAMLQFQVLHIIQYRALYCFIAFKC